MIQKLNVPSVLHYIYTTFTDCYIVKIIVGCFASILALVINGNQDMIFLMFLFYIIDLITGSLVGYKEKKFSSSRFFIGVSKICAYMVFLVIGVSTDMIFKAPGVCLYFILSFILLSDSISILENLKKLGYNVPTEFICKLRFLLDKITKNEEQ